VASFDPNPTPIDPAISPETQLLQLLLQERTLLESYGKDHPQVVSLRARIAVVRMFVEERRDEERRAEERRLTLEEKKRANVPPIIVNLPAPAAPPPPPAVEPAPPKKPERPAPASQPLPKPEPVRSESAPAPEIKPAVEVQRPAPPVGPSLPPALLVGALLGLLLQAVTLVCLLRRPTPRHDGTVRVELVNGGPLVAAPATTPAAAQPRQRTAVRINEETPQPESAAVPIFRQVLADNLRLRTEIAELSCESQA
jgi:hypothetical protein